MSYFAPAKDLYIDFFTLQTTSLINAWVWFFAICTYVNAAWMKENMCQHVCPYSRFQSAMFDDATYLVGYDAERGEGRGKRRRGQEKAAGQGDCVDCDLCVQVCPVGIDIREGLQYECISCGLCIDACDDTMDKFGYKKGLIKFDQIKSSLKDRKQNLAYVSIIAFTVVAMVVWFQQRIVFDLTVSRDRQALYRVNNDGHVENTYIIQIRNKTRNTETYQLAMTGLSDISIVGDKEIVVKPGELKTTTIAVSTPEELTRRQTKVKVNVTSGSRQQSVEQDTSFYSGSH
jgi:cytochrome c oxidase accessory protein FixG